MFKRLALILLILGLPAFAHADVGIVRTQNTTTLLWDRAQPETGIVRYVVGYRTPTTPEVFISASMNTEYVFQNSVFTPSTQYLFRVFSESDVARSDPSNEVGLKTPAVPDTTPPSSPANLQGSGASMFQVNLSWNASSDNIGVAGYSVYRNSIKVSDVTLTSFSDVALQPATTYSYTVSAFDAAGNLSLEAGPVRVSTLGDTTSPSAPGNLTGQATTTQATLNWNASTDNIGVVGYRITRNGTLIATTSGITYTDVALNPGTTYNYTVVATDAAGNASGSATLTLQTVSLPAPCVNSGKPYAISIAVQSWSKQVSIAAGARGRIDFTLSNPFPITQVQVRLGNQVVGEVPTGNPGQTLDLRDMMAQGFSTPRTLGVYNLFITAKDAQGCVTSTTAVRTVTVVQ